MLGLCQIHSFIECNLPILWNPGAFSEVTGMRMW
jgi:hypothetical protein